MQQVHNIGRRRAWVIWLVALSVYLLAVFHRSSLGVAGVLAAERFDVSATELSMFTVLQLVVYAGMQVPIGVLLDRFGAKRMLVTGLLLMTAAQLTFAFATTLPVAIAARAVLGAGDAMTFVSVLRLVTSWFEPRRIPLMTQLTGQLGQLGAVAAAGPLAWALHDLGWTRTFAIVSSVGMVLLVFVLLLVKDSPYVTTQVIRIRLSLLARQVRSVWGNPGTRVGMWSHFVAQFSMTVFAMLWGYPFLVRGEGLSTQTASTLLMVMTGWVVLAGVVLSMLTARFPYYRSVIVLLVVAQMVVAWTAVLLWPGPAPMWLLVIMCLTTAAGGPASMVGFDLARTFLPSEYSGRANGLVNIGGFGASLAVMALIGVVLDLQNPRGMDAYTLDDFKVAMAVQYAFWAFGAVQVIRYRRKALRHLEREHPGVTHQLRRGKPFVHPGFHDREGV